MRETRRYIDFFYIGIRSKILSCCFKILTNSNPLRVIFFFVL